MKACALSMWSTPLSGAYSVLLSSLSHEGSLTIIFRANFEKESALVCFSFNQPYSYKCLARAAHKKRARKFTYMKSKSWLRDTWKILSRLPGKTEKSSELDSFVFLCDEVSVEVISSVQPTVRILGRQSSPHRT
jgi:hypothetical protein